MKISRLTTVHQAKRFFVESLGPLKPYIRDDDLRNFISRPISRLPAFQLVNGDIAGACYS